MTEWGVYLVIASLLATAGLIARPVSALTRTNTRLECAIEKLADAMRYMEKRAEGFDKKLGIHSVSIERHEAEIKNIKEKGREKAV